MGYFCAIDIGASSGRHILGRVSGGKLEIEEIYRFPNNFVKKGGHYVWDTGKLFGEILNGLKKCAEMGKKPGSVGIDTWGVDYVLLGKDGKLAREAISYRDPRVGGMIGEVHKCMGEEELYRRTGIQKLALNTVFQLMAEKRAHNFEGAEKLLMLPDYLNYLLCGEMKTEYTIASTTGLLNAHTRDWDRDIMKACGYPGIFCEIVPPGTPLGRFRPEIEECVGFGCAVVAPASHDTASAVMAMPAESADSMYISSGTWSLMGVLREAPDCSENGRLLNFTNEGGMGDIRYLKNLMGLWMIQCVRNELGGGLSYAQLCGLAELEGGASIVDCADSRFLAPESMIAAIREACAEAGRKPPETPGQLAACVYGSLAHSYKRVCNEIELATNKRYDNICIMGGGSKASHLNRLTASQTGKTVFAGPAEATAAGNLLAQMIALGRVEGLGGAKRLIRASFDIETF